MSSLLEKLKNLLSRINPLVWVSAALGLIAYFANRRADRAENEAASEKAKNVTVREKVILEQLEIKNEDAQKNLDDFVRDFTAKHGHKPGD